MTDAVDAKPSVFHRVALALLLIHRDWIIFPMGAPETPPESSIQNNARLAPPTDTFPREHQSHSIQALRKDCIEHSRWVYLRHPGVCATMTSIGKDTHAPLSAALIACRSAAAPAADYVQVSPASQQAWALAQAAMVP